MQRPFKKLKIHQPSLPAPAATAASERSKVVSNPARLPINRQAALAVRQKQCWIEEPPPERPQTVAFAEYARLQAQLKIERNSHAATRDELGRARASVAGLKQELAGAHGLIVGLSQKIDKLKETIRQLEDLKL